VYAIGIVNGLEMTVIDAHEPESTANYFCVAS
jgi:hypothetical protein